MFGFLKKWKIPLLLIALMPFLWGAPFLWESLTQHPPVLISMSPSVAMPGDYIIIKGHNFGANRNNSGVFLGGDLLTLSSYRSWTDSQIEIQVPQLAPSGLVYINTSRGQSNPLVFTNHENIPEVLAENPLPGIPFLEGLSVNKGAIGQEIEISGENFGAARDQGGVHFAWGPSRDLEVGDSFVVLSDLEILEWTERRIVVRIPTGATSGNVFVSTARGQSNRVYLEVDELAGTKIFTGQTSFTIKIPVEVRVRRASGENSLYIWQPRLPVDALQKGLKVLSQARVPLFQDTQGYSLYRLDNLTSGQTVSLDMEIQFYRYGVEVQPKIDRIHDGYKANIEFYKHYTADDPRLFLANEQIKSLSRQVVGNERNPYLKALRIYNHILDQYKLESRLDRSDLLSALGNKNLSSWSASLLFVALCRTSQIASRPVAGYLVDDNGEPLRHYWAEFFIEGLGWLPVDPLMGSGEASLTGPKVADARRFYFGNTDSSRLATSKEFSVVRSMDTRGYLYPSSIPYSFQDFSHERVGDLDDFQIIWQDLVLEAVY